MTDDRLPGLTPMQLEALALLAEECAEVGAIVGKALRHGLLSCHPSGGPMNAEAIAMEIGDVATAVEIVVQVCGPILRRDIDKASADKWHRVGRYLHYIDIDAENRRATRKP